MSEPVKQHYIPRSYLKNFANCKGKDKCFTDVYFKKEDVLRQNINTKTICYEKHLYTLQTNDESKKYDLELYYANNVDSEFQNIYKLLIDKEKSTLTLEQKVKILYVCLSLYFRTPVHLNHSNAFTDELFNRIRLSVDDKGFVKTKMFGGDKIHIDELDNIKKRTKDDRKTKFQIEHLKKWREFVKFKSPCTINVIQIQDKDAYLVTSDNPVIIRERNTAQFMGLFNPENVITLPLDPKHFLEIHPNSIAKNEFEIQRLTHDRDYVYTTNLMTEDNATNIVIGKKNTLDYHFDLRTEYEEGDNGQKFIDKAKFKAESLQELLRITKTFGGESKEMITQLKKMYSHPHFKGDQQIAQYAEQYKKLGLW